MEPFARCLRRATRGPRGGPTWWSSAAGGGSPARSSTPPARGPTRSGRTTRVATTFWYTRREPVFRDGPFEPEVAGRETIAKVVADVEAGRPTGSVVSYTGLAWTPYALAAKQRGALERRPMFAAIEPGGLREPDGSFTPVDAILWATGFKAALAHLDPMGLRNEHGGIRMTGTQVAGEPRIHLVGFGPSQSTVGANRAGRAAVNALVKYLDATPVSAPS